ncbi:hypothetical protein AWB85_19480, partial [Mycobacteroides immunogenum]
AKVARRKARRARREQDTLAVVPAGWGAEEPVHEDVPFDPQLHDILTARGWVLEYQDDSADSYTWLPSQPEYVGLDQDAMPTNIGVANPEPATLDEIRAGSRAPDSGAPYSVDYAGIGDASTFAHRDYNTRDELLADLAAIEEHRAQS